VKFKIGLVLLVKHVIFGWPLCRNGAKYVVNGKYINILTQN
jgi:hypothetical protein